MLPRLQVSIHRDDVFDFDFLKHIAMRVEKSYLAAYLYRTPPILEHSLCPDLAYRSPRNTRPAAVANVFAAVESTEPV